MVIIPSEPQQDQANFTWKFEFLTIKNAVMKSFLLLILSSLLMNCSQGLAQDKKPEKIIEDDFDFGQLGVSFVKPVDYDYANKLFDNYRDNIKHKAERNRISFNKKLPKRKQQSTAVWISYEEFKAFAEKLEKMEAALNPQKSLNNNAKVSGNNARVSGVRIYFGVHPKETSDKQGDTTKQSKSGCPSPKPVTRNKLTVILCGTYSKDCKDIDIVDNSKRIMLATTYENHGHLCPPEKCEGATLDETIEETRAEARKKNRNKR